MHKNYHKLVIIVAIALILIIANYTIFDHLFNNFFYRITQYPLAFLYRWSSAFSRYPSTLFNLTDLIQENSRLRQENNSLLDSLAQIKELKDENTLLLTRLNLPSSRDRKVILADTYDVRGSGNTTLFVNAGKTDGLKHGMAVVTAENILIGILGEVYDNYSLVLLPRHPSVKLDVEISSRNLIAKSRGATTEIFLDFVTNQDEIEIGDLVVMAGSASIPRGLPIFKVVDVKTSGGGSLFKQVRVAPIVTVADVGKVFILK